MNKPALDISLVILTYNRMDCLAELLAEINDVASLLREVIIIDNCSTDGTGEMISDQYPSFIHHVTDRNRGVCARNIGMAMAQGEIVITIDDDIMGLDASRLQWLCEQFEADPTLGALNFKVLDWYSHKLCNWVHHRSANDADKRFETYEITEGAVAFRRKALAETPMYYETYFISHEGPDLAFRLMNAGYSVVYDGSIAVLHKHEQTSRNPWRFYYYDTRNQLWLAARNMPWLPALKYLFVGLGSMAIYSLRDGYFHWWAAAVRDGMNGLPEMFRSREVWTRSTAERCRDIDRERPGFWKMVSKRLFQPANRLDT